MSILAVDGDGRRASLWCDPLTGGLYITTDPNDTTPLPEGAVRAAAFRTDHKGRLLLADEAPPFERLRNELFGAGEQGIYMPSVHESFLRGDLYQDAAGTTPVTAVGQPVGLWLDRSQGLELGPELVTNGDFSDGLTGWSKVGTTGDSYLDGNSCIVEHLGDDSWSAREQSLTGKIVPGRTYVLEADITMLQAGQAFLGLWVGSVVRGPLHTGGIGEKKRYRWVYTTSSPTFLVRIATYHNAHARFENVSVRELPGNHASQSTAASRPTLQQDANGIYCLWFDGVNDNMVTPSIDFTGTEHFTLLGGWNPPEDLNRSFIGFSDRAFGWLSLYSRKFDGLATGTAAFNEGTNIIGGAFGKRVASSSLGIDGNWSLRQNGAGVASAIDKTGGVDVGEQRIALGHGNALEGLLMGDIYGLIVCGAQKSLAQIEQAEALINRYTRAF